MLPSFDTLQVVFVSWRRSAWPTKTAKLLLAVPVAGVAWPILIGSGYSILVRSRLQSRRVAFGLVSIMALTSVVAQGAWLHWLSGELVAGLHTPPSIAQTDQPETNDTTGVVAAAETTRTGSTLEAQVTKVINGSLLTVSIRDESYTVRLIGLMAPDPGSHTTPPACFGLESQRYLQGLVGAGRVQLSTDEQLTDRDEFGMMQRYIVGPDGSLINRQMLDAGMAEENGGPNYDQKVSFVGAQEAAKADRRGLWGSCASQVAPTPATAPTSTPTPVPSISTAVARPVQPVVPTPVATVAPTPSIPTPTSTPTPTVTATPTPSPTPSP